jgi:hypothetical protein
VTKLRLIDSSAAGPPRPLGRVGAALWDRVCRDFDITDAAGIELLCLACQALDRAEACREQIDYHGEAAVNEAGYIRQNPLLRDELANRAFVSKTLERLGLNTEPVKSIGRPTGSWQHEPKAKKSSA